MSEKYKKEISEILKKCEEGSTDKLKKRELSKIWKYKLLNKEYEWLFNNFEIFNKIPDLQDKIIDRLIEIGEYSILFDNFDKLNERTDLQDKIIDSCIEKKLFYTMFKNIDKIESYEKYIVEKV